MTYYDILGVNENADQQTIKSAYKNLIKKYHPDLYQGDKSFAEKKTKEINEAYDILSNSEKKAEYDISLHPSVSSSDYQYTPPKYNYTHPGYDSYSKNYYSDYYDRYSTKNTSEYSDYQKRYTDYHRSKTPNSHYDEARSKIMQNYGNVKNKLVINIIIVLVVLVIYMILFLSSISQFNSYKNGEIQGTIINPEKVTPQDNESTSSSEKEFPDFDGEFDINDYFTDSELRQIYYKYYTEEFETFEEFKEALSEYIQEYYDF